MDCPRCHRPLTTESAHGVDLERCQGCTGLFLDRGCLDKIAEPHEGDLEFSTLDQETFHHDDTHGVTECPACAGARMRKVEFIIHTGIILDYCVLCGGFWLDGKELDRVNKEVRELNEASDEAVAPAMLWFANFIWALPR